MTELSLILIPFLLTDILSPVLFAFLIYTAGTDRPVRNSIALLLGHTTAYFIVGFMVALGLDQIIDRLAHPRRVDFAIEMGVALLLLYVALRSRNESGKQPAEVNSTLSLADSLLLGATLSFVGVPFAIPYFAALAQILKADLETVDAVLVLGLYNLAYALPFLSVPIIIGLLGERGRQLLVRINVRIERMSEYLMPILLGLIGLALAADVIAYWITGKGLI